MALSVMSEEGSGSRSGSAAVMPEQFQDLWHRHGLTPESQLQVAILEQAVEDLRRPRRNRQSERSYREALGWMTSDNEGWPFSFVNVCLSLGLDPAAVRLELLEEHPGAGGGSETPTLAGSRARH
jgi:hypothetical protein